MTRAVTDVSPRMLPLFVATAALAMTFSYLALFAPFKCAGTPVSGRRAVSSAMGS